MLNRFKDFELYLSSNWTEIDIQLQKLQKQFYYYIEKLNNDYYQFIICLVSNWVTSLSLPFIKENWGKCVLSEVISELKINSSTSMENLENEQNSKFSGNRSLMIYPCPSSFLVILQISANFEEFIELLNTLLIFQKEKLFHSIPNKEALFDKFDHLDLKIYIRRIIYIEVFLKYALSLLLFSEFEQDTEFLNACFNQQFKSSMKIIELFKECCDFSILTNENFRKKMKKFALNKDIEYLIINTICALIDLHEEETLKKIFKKLNFNGLNENFSYFMIQTSNLFPSISSQFIENSLQIEDTLEKIRIITSEQLGTISSSQPRTSKKNENSYSPVQSDLHIKVTEEENVWK